MVLTFALCATFVFAQTATPRMKGEYKAPAKVAQVQNEYSSSIFTKDETPLFTCDFHADNEGYSTGTVIGGIEGHAENYAYATWRRIPNADSTTCAAEAATYPVLAQALGGVADFASAMMNWADSSVSSAENGFMMMDLYEQRTQHSGNFNAYILFEGIDASSAARVDVEFYQYYRKYYENCYIDYNVSGNTWVETEINVTGVDMGVNGTLRGFVKYTIPSGAGLHSNLNLRIRYKSLDSDRGGYGYWWILDDVAVYAGEANRMQKYAQEYVEGNYGMIPQGMDINPAWYTHVYNNGSISQFNANAKLYHLPATMDVATEFDSYNNGTINVDDQKDVIVDRAGWLLIDSLGYRGWYGYIDGTSHGSGNSLPTSVLGDNYVFASLTTDSLTINYDTILYQVTGIFDNFKYRWAHDNGVLTYSPSNHYLIGYVQQGGNWYITEDPDEVHFYEPGYEISSRYTTGNIVPEDWVIHGVELVASPATRYYSTGVRISGFLRTDEYEGGSVGFAGVNTGANVKEITHSDINDSNIIGRNSAGYLTQGDYNTIFIAFPEQPALEPNTSYRVGYSIEETGYLALAEEAHGSYRMASPTRPDTYDTIIYFANDEATAKYAHIFTPNQYQNFFRDPIKPPKNSTFASWYIEDYSPMIRMIVGPRQEVERRDIEVSCDSSDYGEVAYAGQDACGETIHPVQGSTATITIMTYAGCDAIITVDGEVVEVWNEEEETGDRNLVGYYNEDDNTFTYQYSFPDIQTNHTINVTFYQAGTISIDPVAAGVRMNLQPNPATSQVNLNLQGVTGMVNCMLIDMSGRVVYDQNINAETAHTINLNSLAKGAYFVRITNDKFSKVEKLIVR